MKRNHTRKTQQFVAIQRVVLNDNPGPQIAKFGAGIIRGKVGIIADGPEMKILLQSAGIHVGT